MILAPLTAAVLAHPTLRHGFFTRRGGVSNGIYASLNAGFTSGDDRVAVLENRNRVAKFLGLPGGERLVTGDQMHRAEIVLVTAPWPADRAPQADGLVSKERGLALGILTADCAPVLFADTEAGVLGACHAGWRGALGGIIAATVSAMTKLGAKRNRIAAAIGPCIGARSYEVSDAFAATFLDADPETMDFFEPAREEGRAMFDLGQYVLRHLEQQRLGAIEYLGVDTLTDPDRFYSYRRETLEQGRPPETYGRLISAIARPE